MFDPKTISISGLFDFFESCFFGPSSNDDLLESHELEVLRCEKIQREFLEVISSVKSSRARREVALYHKPLNNSQLIPSLKNTQKLVAMPRQLIFNIPRSLLRQIPREVFTQHKLAAINLPKFWLNKYMPGNFGTIILPPPIVPNIQNKIVLLIRVKEIEMNGSRLELTLNNYESSLGDQPRKALSANGSDKSDSLDLGLGSSLEHTIHVI